MDRATSHMRGVRRENEVDGGRMLESDTARSESGEQWSLPVRRLGVSMRELGISSCPYCGHRVMTLECPRS